VARPDRSDLRDRHAGLSQHLEQESLEVVVGAIQLVDQQHRGHRPGMLNRLQQGPGRQELPAKQLVLAQPGAGRLRRSDPQQLAGVVPLVERLGGVDALVALKSDQPRVERRRQRLGCLRLADTRLALEQQGLRQPEREEKRRGEPVVGQVIDLVESPLECLDVGDRLGHRALRAWMRRGRHGDAPAAARIAS
jgi:hypothetical protein